MGARNAIAIDWGRRRLRVAVGSVGRAGVRLQKTLAEPFPESLDAADAAAVGRWIRERLDAARIAPGKAIVALGREIVGIKRISLPTTEDEELPDMTRLAMQREVPFAAESAVIDFVPAERTGAGATVLAVAAPAPAIEHVRRVADAAGLTIERITLRCMGVAALLRTLPVPEPTAVSEDQAQQLARQKDEPAGALGIDITGDGVEFCIIVGRHIRFARAAEVPQPQDLLSIADAVVTEARRTWMSYRIAEPNTDIRQAWLMGDGRVSEYASPSVQDILNIPSQALGRHPKIDAQGRELDHVWPLAGLLLEPTTESPMIDLASPRRAPDVGARTRQRRLLAAGAAIVALLGAWTYIRHDLQSLDRSLQAANERVRKEFPDYNRYIRDTFRLEHLKNWQAADVDWLRHATYLSTIAPPPEKVVLDSWNGTLDFRGVMYDRKTHRWWPEESLTIVIDGEAKDRETADAFRGALVKNSIYTTTTTGGDSRSGKRLPFGFTYRLRTTEQSPPAAEPEKAAAAAKDPKDAKQGEGVKKGDDAKTEVASR